MKQNLIEKIRKCTICKWLPLWPRPIVNFSKDSKILIIGQAPGSKVHSTWIPWDDPSGERLRQWLGITKEVFYDDRQIALMPMGFCYPGTGASWDLPPRKECAPIWHEQALEEMENLKLIILIGQYAQKYYLWKNLEKKLTETVRNYKNYLPKYFVLPHPSPRNNIWMKKNEWFETDVLPELEKEVGSILGV